MRSIPLAPENGPPRETSRTLMETSHVPEEAAAPWSMEPTKPQKVVLLVLAVFMVCAWALVIWIATVVTQTALETLSYIVELAQYTP